MDFGTLLHVAKRNSVNDADKVRCYSTKFSPPKKETKDRKLSENVQKFLKKKAEEDQEKERQRRERCQELLASRDNKSRNKINKMLKVTKSANKSVLDDAMDQNNTSVTMQGPEQPDEDDYGYVSQESCALYKRLMDKYGSAPAEAGSKFASKPSSSAKSMNAIKNRVAEALKAPPNDSRSSNHYNNNSGRSKSNASSTSKSTNAGATDSTKTKTSAAAEKPKTFKRPAVPPPPDFYTLLKLAEQKQFEPIKVEEVKKEERPMTSKEKQDHEERMRLAEARRKRLECENYDYRKAAAAASQEPNKSSSSSSSSLRIPKLGDKPSAAGPQSRNKEPIAGGSKNPVQQQPSTKTSDSVIKSSFNDKRSAVAGRAKPPADERSAAPSKPPPYVPERTRQFPPSDVGQKTRQFPPADVQRSRPFPPADVRRPVARKRSPEMEYQPRAIKRNRIEDYSDDEDEYDSEMDDFIDDGPENENNVSGYIKEIFGYDKHRFRDEVFDDREMESSFAQQMREEYISKKVGQMEDLEDMRQEEIDKAKKLAAKKKLNRR